MQKLADNLGAIPVRLGREQRVLAVEEAVLLVSDLPQNSVDLQYEGRFEVLVGDGGAVAGVERPRDARLDTAQEHARLGLSQQHECGVSHVAMDDESGLYRLIMSSYI